MAQTTIRKVLEQADDLLVEQKNKLGPLPGLAVGVVHKGELLYARGFGMADAQKRLPVTRDTVFRIGSISKTFTGIAVMQLCEQGKLWLDAPVNDYLKHYRVAHPDPNAPPVTIRHMLTHTSGIGETPYTSDLFHPSTNFGTGIPEHERVPGPPEFYGQRLVTEIYPGQKWAYANHAFKTLGQVIEDVSGQPYRDYMREHILDPLGMAVSDFERTAKIRERLAEGYEMKNGSLRPVRYLHIFGPASGGMFSSVTEMASYMAALMNGGGGLVKPETLESMWQPQHQLDERLPGMGLAFWLEKIGEHRVVQHGGGWNGFISMMMVAPDAQLGVVVFANISPASSEIVARDLLRRLLDVPEIALPQPGVMESPHLWGELCGAYGPKPGFKTNLRTWMMFGGEVEVYAEGRHLKLRGVAGPLEKGVTLYPADPDDPLYFYAAVPNQPTQVVFKRDTTGQIARLCIRFSEFHKRPAPVSIPLAREIRRLDRQYRAAAGSLFVWFASGMPNRLRVARRVLVILFLFMALRSLRQNRAER